MIVGLMSYSLKVGAWERLSDGRTALTDPEVEYLLKAEQERTILREQDKLKDQKIDILNQQLSLKQQEIDLERKRADFAESQVKKVMEISEFQAKQYQELLKASKGSGFKDNLMYGIVGVAIGVLLKGISW